MNTSHPDHVGSYAVNGEFHFYSTKRTELDRSGLQMARWLRSYDFPPGSYVLTISSQEEIIHFASFEFAVQVLGLYGTNADDSPFDAGRVESLSRQFSPVAIAGVSSSTLEGLKMMGHDPEKVFSGKTVWARPDAFAAVDVMDSVSARRLCMVGPALAFECAHGGLHIDGREWSVSQIEGELTISSRIDRIERLTELPTGIKGDIHPVACTCGSSDPLILIG